jgi:hypothetical protein
MTQRDEAATDIPLRLSSRIAQMLHQAEPIRDLVAVRRTVMGFGRGVVRGDDVATVAIWLHGQMYSEFPVVHLRRRMDGGLFDQIAVRHVDAL